MGSEVYLFLVNRLGSLSSQLLHVNIYLSSKLIWLSLLLIPLPPPSPALHILPFRLSLSILRHTCHWTTMCDSSAGIGRLRWMEGTILHI